ncbi:transketolase [Anopheles sinensis]|uniref:Transketolase n=1 Tax=Anopheles sinensis TaxID=74873 RepID=A0A084VY15_ANOSI|nr:transketolase [Anopheles sinensis]
MHPPERTMAVPKVLSSSLDLLGCSICIFPPATPPVNGVAIWETARPGNTCIHRHSSACLDIDLYRPDGGDWEIPAATQDLSITHPEGGQSFLVSCGMDAWALLATYDLLSIEFDESTNEPVATTAHEEFVLVDLPPWRACGRYGNGSSHFNTPPEQSF